MRVPSLIVLAGCSIIQLSAQSEKPNAAVLPCVQSLQSAAALNDWNPKQLATLTESCVSEGRAADAEKILLALHDTTSGLHRRLQLLELLEWTATSAGDLPKLKELFAARHEGDRALALLELSELGASPSSYPERRKLLTQVAGLAAENAELLVEIQDRQEAEGYWTDALATAESWVAKHQSAEAKCRLASLQLIAGDDAEGWDLAEKVIGNADLRPRDLIGFARVACELKDWRRAADLLTKARPLFPRDLGLLGVRAVALEEAGRDDEAVAAFLELLGTREELVSDESVGLDEGGTPGLYETRLENSSGEPPGTRDFRMLSNWSRLAYAHRAIPEPYGTGRQMGPAITVHLPSSRDEARLFALVHLRKLAANGTKVTEGETDRSLAAVGLDHLAGTMGIVGTNGWWSDDWQEILRAHPDNEPLYAWCLELGRPGPEDAAILQHSIQLFSEHYPRLAFAAAWRLGNLPGPNQETCQNQALVLFQRLVGENDVSITRTAYDLTARTKDWANARAWQDVAFAVLEKAAAELPVEWTKSSRQSAQGINHHEVASGLLYSMMKCGRWEDFAGALEVESRQQASVTWMTRGNSYAIDDAIISFPNLVFGWSPALIGYLGPYYDPATRRASGIAPTTEWIERIGDPWLKVVTQWRFGDEAAARAEMERRIASPEANLKDWWLAAWFAWEKDTVFSDEPSEQQATLLAAERLAHAASFPMEEIVRKNLDAALLRAVLALQERPAALVEAARAAARRFCERSLSSTYDGEDLKAAFETLEFTDEAARVKSLPVVPLPSESLARSPRLPPSTTLARLRRSPPRLSETDEPSKKPQAPEIIVRDAIGDLHQLQPGADRQGAAGQIRQRLEAGNHLQAALAAAAPREGATSVEVLRAARDFELLGQTATARENYEAALRLNPKLDEARAAVVILTLSENLDASLALLNGISEEGIGPLLQRLTQMQVADWRTDETDRRGPVALDLMTRWLVGLSKSNSELPAAAVMPIQGLMLESKQHFPELCRAALPFRELADIAFGSIAEDSLRKKIQLTEVTELAKDLLRAKAEWARGPHRNAGGYKPRTEAFPADEIVSQPGVSLILIWDAWQRHARQEVEEVILPLLHSTGNSNDDAIRMGAALFFCPPDRFLEAAGDFLQSEIARREITGNIFTDRFFPGGALDFITLVWRVRKLDVPLESLFLSELARPASGGGSMDALVHYIGLSKMTTAQAANFVRGLRDQLVNRDPARRKFLLGRIREITRYEPVPERWQRKRALPASVRRYASWLGKLLAEPSTCRVALDMAIEDGLTIDRRWPANGLNSVFDGPEQLIALLDGFSMLSPARDFRTWAMDGNQWDSMLGGSIRRLADNRDSFKTVLETLRSRKPETFGSAFVLSCVAAQNATHEEQQKIMRRFISGHGSEFDLIPLEHWPEIRLFLGNAGNWDKPWILSEEDRLALMPVIKANHRYLAHFAKQVMAAEHWDDVHFSGYGFDEQSSRAFISLAESDPIKAAALASHVFELLVKPAKTPGPRSVNTPENPLMEWIYHTSQTTAAMAALRPAVEQSKVIAQLPQMERDKISRVIRDAALRLAK